jgi:hypothetical protein
MSTAHTNVPTNAYAGQCRHCMTRGPVVGIARSGGGTYRRGGRSYSSSICGDCAVELLTNARPSGSVHGFSAVSLGHIVAKIDTDEARKVHAAFREAADAYFADIRERRARHAEQ